MIYLDNAATTKPDPRVIETMMPFLQNEYGNAGSIHNLGRTADKAVERARGQVAKFLHCYPEQIVFTAGGTEANNLALGGVVNYLKTIGKTHILVSSVEHDSVLRSAKELINQECVQLLPVDAQGVVSAETVERYIQKNTGLVSVMYVNNEVGAINPVKEIGELCERHGVLFHTDCVQAAGTYKINVRDIGCDLASISSHKIHSVKGVGALYIRDKSILSPLIVGGSTQEFGLRGGTENVPGIVAFGKACEICGEELDQDLIYVSTLKQVFYRALLDTMPDEHIIVNGASPLTPGKILNLQFEGVDAETLLLLLDSKGVYISAGSACTSHELTPSHVLEAMGLSDEEARHSVRVSFSKDNTEKEVVKAAQIMAECIKCARGFMP